ncbi:MAG: response regulator [Caulobacteraceae bacterium]|nr:response regulator [Caulobacter sp.]RYF91809.1 MAG: response regulator [Caulobacteraceae bacterium]
MSTGLGSLRVLLVDDNPHMRTIVATILMGVGIRHVRQAQDGAEALQALRAGPADLAIVDFQMQPLDGASFTRLVRGDAEGKNTYLPIIMMTSFADRVRVVEARDAGITEMIAKPLTARAVLDRLGAVIMRPRPFVRTDDYFGPMRRGIDALPEPPRLRELAI